MLCRGDQGTHQKPQKGSGSECRVAPTSSGWLQGPAGLMASPEAQTPETTPPPPLFVLLDSRVLHILM